MFKKAFFVMFMIIIIFGFSGTVKAREPKEKNKIVYVIDNGVVSNYITSTETIKEFLIENNITLNEQDYINKKMDSSIFNNLNIEIKRPFWLNILLDNEPKNIKVNYDDKISDLIKTLNQEYKKDFICELDNNFNLRNCDNIELFSRVINLIEYKKIIPFETQIIYSDKLNKNYEEVQQEGVNGEKLIKEEIIFINNKEASRDLKSQEIIKSPINKIIIKGTSEYKNILLMHATAYTAGFESTGKRPGDKNYGITATGTKAKHGTVAVDPKIIPLGSKLYIEGYGHATALDTGKAIKGNKIDLFFDSLRDAKKFGRKNLKVYIY